MLRPPESPNARTRRAWRATRLIGLFVAALAACSGPGSEPFDPSRVPLVATFDAPPEGPMGERLAWVLALLNGEVDAPSVEHAPFVWGYTLLDRSSADDLARAFERAEQLGPYTLVGAFITTYLLEKTRVCFQAKQERNYHIFFDLLSHADQYEQDLFLQVDVGR